MAKRCARKQRVKRTHRTAAIPTKSNNTRAKRRVAAKRFLARRSSPIAESLVSIALGFDRCHPKVWHHMRESGVMYVGGHDASRWARAQKYLAVNRRVMVYAPKQQGGTGLLGIGTIVQIPIQFENGGKIIRTSLGDELIGYMRDVFSKEENQATAPKKNLLSRSFKAQSSWLAECGQRTCWQVGQRWLSDKEFLQYNQTQVPLDRREGAWTGAFRVQWEITVPFEKGVLEVDWSRNGAAPAQLSSLHSLTPRNFDDAQVQSMILSLKATGDCTNHTVDSRVAQSKITPAPSERSEDAVEKSRAGQTNGGASASSRVGNGVEGDIVERKARVEKVPVGYDDVAALLAKCGLQQYFPRLVSEEVNMVALKLLSDEDFKSMGIPLGPRRILQATLTGKAV